MTAFRPLLLISLGLALLALVTPLVVGPANKDLAIRASAIFAVIWLATLVFAVFKFKMRGLWLLSGTPLVAFWFFVLFLIAWGCAHTLRLAPDWVNE